MALSLSPASSSLFARNSQGDYRVREAQLAQYNYILVVGESEASTGQVSVRIRDSAVHSVKSIEDLLEEFKTKTAEYQ